MMLSIIIVNYNTCALLRACLQSIADSATDFSLETIVVDNASKDDSAKMVRTEFPSVQLFALSKNIWFCGGNNYGIDRATGEYILLLNPDTVLEQDTLSQLVHFLQNNPGYVGVSGQMRYPEGGIQQTCARIPTYKYLLLNYSIISIVLPKQRQKSRYHILYGDWKRDSDRDVEAIPASCTLMRRERVYLDNSMLLYFPEEDLAQRIKQYGKFRFLADAKIIHHESSVTKTWSAQQIFFRDMLVYTRKYHGLLATIFLWLCSRPLVWGIGIKRKFTDL